MRIPSHILYPGMVLTLLGTSVLMTMFLLFSSRSDDGAQIMPDYYEHAIAWDSEEAVRRESRALNWRITLEFRDNAQGVLSIIDHNARPVEGLDAQVHLRRPQYAEDLAVAELQPAPDASGTYTFDAPPSSAGYWDVIVEGEYDGRPIHLSHRQRVP